MCGLVAAISESEARPPLDAVRAAMDSMMHRGPDGEGLWHEAGVVVGHRRLAILDLETRAAQPMHSVCGRYVIVFNGEIYNFRDLRRALESRGNVFRTTSDTEIILALFANEGEAMLPRLHGMFAFVIWDREKRRAFAARDPYGIKPLYIANVPEGVLLASQVKALLASGLVSREPDPHGQAGFWMLGSVPEPRTWFRDIQMLPAGNCAWIGDGRVLRQSCWHDIGRAWRDADGQPMPPIHAVREGVRSVLQDSVKRHMVADVPVGVFLSGGIDSGSVAGLMVESGAPSLEGVTLAYDEFLGRHEDESPLAAQIAAHYGVRHTIRKVSRAEFLNDLPKIFEAMDQPSIDGVNTWYASKAAAERGLKVVVSGVGGDELFQGYSHFRTLPRLLALRQSLRAVPGSRLMLEAAGRFQANRTGNARWGHLEGWTRTIEGAWWLRRSTCAPEQLPELMGAEPAREALAEFDVVEQVRSMTGTLPNDPLLALGQMESMIYLRNQLLRDSDWASMHHGVELRTPLVDAHLLAQASRWLIAFSRGPNKGLLAQAPVRPLPKGIVQRNKTGFGIPVGRWISGIDQSLAGVWAREVGAGCYPASK